MPSEAEILFHENGRAGIATLNRPQAYNALTLTMIRGLEAHHLKWARSPKIYGVLLRARGEAFCSGGDLRALYEQMQAGEKDAALAYFREEYQHCWTLQSFTKPNVALIDGLMMGGGAGICLYGTHRVAGDGFAFAMPETGIGFFPDVGGSYFLPRMRGQIGVYLALSGHAMNAADAYWLGVVTHCIASERFPQIEEALAQSDPIDPFLDSLHRDPGESELASRQPVIDHCFSASSVEDILSRLGGVSDRDEAWAKDTAKILRRRSPVSLKVTLRLLRESRNSLKCALQSEYRVTARLLDGEDFAEGIRAKLIDKDQTPLWKPASLQAVSGEMVASYFAPLADRELTLKDHWTLVE